MTNLQQSLKFSQKMNDKFVKITNNKGIPQLLIKSQDEEHIFFFFNLALSYLKIVEKIFPTLNSI